jgi:hypothetical protein
VEEELLLDDDELLLDEDDELLLDELELPPLPPPPHAVKTEHRAPIQTHRTGAHGPSVRVSTIVIADPCNYFRHRCDML